MFVRTSTRRNKDGSPVRYLQLAHNEWDPARKASRTKVVYNFGRAEELDRAGIERLIGALSRLLGTQPPAAGDQVAGLPGLEFAESRPLGGTWLLDQLWHRLGIDMSMQRLLAGTVWANYELVITQWPSDPTTFKTADSGGIYPADAGGAFPVDGAVNATMETYFQTPQDAVGAGGNSCMRCHYAADLADFSWVLQLRAH